MTGDLDETSAVSKAEAVMMVPQTCLGQQVPALSNDVAAYWMGRALALPREENGFHFQRSLPWLDALCCWRGVLAFGGTLLVVC
jgi:hypothetical protein